MVQGTTPLHIFKFPVEILDNYSNMIITYRQDGRTVLEKVLSDVSIEGNTALLRLAQEETLLFEPGKYYVQVKVLTKDNRVQASAKFGGTVTSALNDDLLEEDTVVDPFIDIRCIDVIIRGTTPVIYYEPRHINIENFTEAFLNIKQNGKLVIEKTINDAEIINDMFVWVLTQEDTISLQPFTKAIISCPWKLSNGTRGESRLMVCNVFNSTMNGVI